MSYIEVCSKVAQVVFDLLILVFGTRRRSFGCIIRSQLVHVGSVDLDVEIA